MTVSQYITDPDCPSTPALSADKGLIVRTEVIRNAADLSLIARWDHLGIKGDYDEDGPFTAAEYDQLAVIYRKDPRELAIVLDCKSLDYPPTADADIDEDEANCPACQGTGIGAADGPCYECNGCGLEGGPWRPGRYGYADDDAEVWA